MTRILLRVVAIVTFGCMSLLLIALAIGHALVLPDNELLFDANLQGYDSDIYRLDIAHRLMMPVAKNSDVDTEPVWSPDGQQIAFDSNRAGRYTIYLMDAQGENIHPLKDDSTYAYNPAWSPDGRSIAYLTTQFPISRELMLTDLQSGTTRRLTDNREAESSPNWSSDGRHMIFAYDTSNPKYRDIFDLDLQTGDINPFIVTPDTERSPNWSADGRSVLYIADGLHPGIYIWDIEHAQSTLVYALEAFNVYAPNWSADGRFIVYAPLTSNNDNHIFVLDVTACLQKTDVCQPQALPLPSGIYASPHWRPNPP
jgi:Tol biopolymer transport system component